MCYYGRPLTMFCNDGLHWNNELKKCDFPESANCQVTEIDPLPTCPINGTHFFPHPTNCEAFIFCLFGERSVQLCPFYQHWDIYENRCIIKTEATCILDVESTTTEDPTISSTTDGHPEPNLDCPEVDDPNSLVFFPSTTNCTK